MPNAYTIKLGGRPARPEPIYHRGYYFFNTNRKNVPAFITTPNLYFMNSNLQRLINSGSNRLIREKLVQLTGGAPHGESRARRMVNNALQQRIRNHRIKKREELERVRVRSGQRYNIAAHERQIKFYNNLRIALGNGNMTREARLPNNNKRINLVLQQRIKSRQSKLDNRTKYNAVRQRQRLLENHIKTSTNLGTILYREGINPHNTNLNSMKHRRNAVGSAVREFLRTRNALKLNVPPTASRRRSNASMRR